MKAIAGITLSVAVLTSVGYAQQPSPKAAAGAPPAALILNARSANVAEPGTPVRIHLFRWSTDEERAPIVAALNPAPPPPPPPIPPPAPVAATSPEPPPAEAAAADAAAGAGAGQGRGRGARGGAGRGAAGRGAARGRPAAPPPSPIAAFTAAIGRAPTVGYIWTSDVTGYSIRYAWRSPLPDGGQRIVLVTDRRFGGYSAAWKPQSTAPATDYEFTVFELRLDSKGTGEGRASLTTKVVADSEAKTVGLEDYAAAPAILSIKK